MNGGLVVGNSNGNSYITTANRLYRCHFRELNLPLCLGYLEKSLLPSVIGLLADTIFFAPVLDVLTAAAALRDPPGPQGEFVLRISCL